MSDLKEMILEYGRRARGAARLLARTSTAQRNAGVCAMADALVGAEAEILAANLADVEQAGARGLSGAMVERLTLSGARV